MGELPTAIDLPAADKPGPFAVGKISAPPGAAWQLALVGGDAAFKNSRQLTRKLVLQEKDPGPDKPSWQVALSETSAAGEEQGTRRGEVLPRRRFLEVPMAAGRRPAGNRRLRYCALAVQVGDARKTVGLIKPKVVRPLVIDLQKPLAHCSVELDEVPPEQAAAGNRQAGRLRGLRQGLHRRKAQTAAAEVDGQPRSDDEGASRTRWIFR